MSCKQIGHHSQTGHTGGHSGDHTRAQLHFRVTLYSANPQHIEGIQQDHRGIIQELQHHRHAGDDQKQRSFPLLKIGNQAQRGQQKQPILHQFKLRCLNPFCQEIDMHENDPISCPRRHPISYHPIEPIRQSQVDQCPADAQVDHYRVHPTCHYCKQLHQNRRRIGTELMRLPHIENQSVPLHQAIGLGNCVGFVNIHTEENGFQHGQYTDEPNSNKQQSFYPLPKPAFSLHQSLTSARIKDSAPHRLFFHITNYAT